MLINAKKRLSADPVTETLGLTLKDFIKLFKVWNADFLGVNTRNIADDFEFYGDNRTFAQDLYTALPYDSDEEPCSLCQDFPVSEWATFSMDMACHLKEESYKLPKGANQIDFSFYRTIDAIPDEDGKYPKNIEKGMAQFNKKAFNVAVSRLKAVCRMIETPVGYFHFVDSDCYFSRKSDLTYYLEWSFKIWFIPFSE